MIDISYSVWLFLVFVVLCLIIGMQIAIFKRQSKLLKDYSVFAKVLKRISGDLPN